MGIRFSKRFSPNLLNSTAKFTIYIDISSLRIEFNGNLLEIMAGWVVDGSKLSW